MLGHWWRCLPASNLIIYEYIWCGLPRRRRFFLFVAFRIDFGMSHCRVNDAIQINHLASFTNPCAAIPLVSKIDQSIHHLCDHVTEIGGDTFDMVTAVCLLLLFLSSPMFVVVFIGFPCKPFFFSCSILIESRPYPCHLHNCRLFKFCCSLRCQLLDLLNALWVFVCVLSLHFFPVVFLIQTMFFSDHFLFKDHQMWLNAAKCIAQNW